MNQFEAIMQVTHSLFFKSKVSVAAILYTVRPRDTRPQAARTSTVHDFELGPKNLEKHVFLYFSL